MKRTGVEKSTTMNKDGNGEPSTSSTSLKMSQEQSLTTDNKIEGGGNSSKKMKRGESSNSGVGTEAGAGQSQESIVKGTSMDNILCDESFKNFMNVEVGASQVEESKVKEVSMDNLPPEMLTKILQCIKNRSLFDFRLVSRQWSEIASGILRNRPTPFTCFRYTPDGCLWNKGQRWLYKQRSLRDFLRCIKNSKNCPFSQFFFLNTEEENLLKIFGQKDFMEFISYFGSPNQRLKCLHLNFYYLQDLETLKRFTLNLRDLLLNKIPRLEELTLEIYVSFEAPEVKLFSAPKQTHPQKHADPIPVLVQLANLKVLRIGAPMIIYCPEIVKDLLNAAVNLKYIRMWIFRPGEFHFLHSLGKLHLLKEAKIVLSKYFLSEIESDENDAPLSLPLPKLEILDLALDTESELGQRYFKQGTNFLGPLFESSKDTLTELKTHPLGFFPDLQLPTFKNLRKLELIQPDALDIRAFPHGTRSRDVFPFVSELDLDICTWNFGFPQEDSIPLLPKVKTLTVTEGKNEEINTAVVALMCPNLIKFKIQKHGQLSPFLKILQGVPSMWTDMQNLESLEFDVDLDVPENNRFAFDSCFTGISLENCEHLCKMKEAQEMLENYGVSVEVPEAKFQALAQRQYPSILDMKDLKTLIINPYSGETLLERMDFWTKLTCVSEEYAFKFLPHLKPKPTEEEED